VLRSAHLAGNERWRIHGRAGLRDIGQHRIRFGFLSRPHGVDCRAQAGDINISRRGEIRR
jgi:hypothetical protein